MLVKKHKSVGYDGLDNGGSKHICMPLYLESLGPRLSLWGLHSEMDFCVYL